MLLVHVHPSPSNFRTINMTLCSEDENQVACQTNYMYSTCTHHKQKQAQLFVRRQRSTTVRLTIFIHCLWLKDLQNIKVITDRENYRATSGEVLHCKNVSANQVCAICPAWESSWLLACPDSQTGSCYVWDLSCPPTATMADSRSRQPTGKTSPTATHVARRKWREGKL